MCVLYQSLKGKQLKEVKKNYSREASSKIVNRHSAIFLSISVISWEEEIAVLFILEHLLHSAINLF